MTMDQTLLDSFATLQPSVDMKLLMDRYLKPLPPQSKILEIGVGNGWTSNTLHDLGHDVSTIDFSPACLKLLHPDIPKLQLNIETDDFPFEPGSFDMILMLAVLEHLTDPKKVLEKLKHLLKPGGTFIGSTPNINWFPFRLYFLFGRCPEDFHTTNHVQFWNLRHFKMLFEHAGFTVEKQFTSLAFPNLLYPFVRHWQKGFFEILNKYLFLGTELRSKLFGYNQTIIART
jgi:2-polyprenyl-3-methyl-5-hydroxy-6-metoxy-1,4-benzoquinol methylase